MKKLIAITSMFFACSAFGQDQEITGWSEYKFGDSFDSVLSKSKGKIDDRPCQIDQVKRGFEQQGIYCKLINTEQLQLGGLEWNGTFTFSNKNKDLIKIGLRLNDPINIENTSEKLIEKFRQKYGSGKLVDESFPADYCEKLVSRRNRGERTTRYDENFFPIRKTYTINQKYGSIIISNKLQRACDNPEISIRSLEVEYLQLQQVSNNNL